MKKLLITILASLLLCACGRVPAGESGAAAASAPESSHDTDESSYDPEAVYPFLRLEDIVTTRSSASGRTFIYEYFISGGKVAGAKLCTVLQTEREAKEYRASLLKRHPDAVIKGKTVTIYVAPDDDDYYFIGIPLEKLLYMLDLNGIEYTLNFNPDDTSAESK